MQWKKVKQLMNCFNDTADDGYIAVGYYANGARNFYLKDDIAVTDTTVLNRERKFVQCLVQHRWI